MYMDEGLDTGDILLQRKIDISPNETSGSLHDRLAQIAPEALLESLRRLSTGNAPRTPQANALASYALRLSREDGRIDWSEPAAVIERKIRAYNPWPGAFTMLTEKSGRQHKLKIFRATTVDLSGAPGQILGADERGLVIAAGDRGVSLQQVQLEGKRKMGVAEFMRGFPQLKVDRPLRGRC
jgi:methionyl-tRNA formyltransferase